MGRGTGTAASLRPPRTDAGATAVLSAETGAPAPRTIVDHDTEPAADAPSKLPGFCYIASPLGNDVGHVDALLHDATLQPGDSVMTAKGVRVFKGGRDCPHENTDFLALAEIRGLPKHERRALAAIDKVIKTPRVAVQVGGFAIIAARAAARASHE